MKIDEMDTNELREERNRSKGRRFFCETASLFSMTIGDILLIVNLLCPLIPSVKPILFFTGCAFMLIALGLVIAKSVYARRIGRCTAIIAERFFYPD